MGKWTLLSELVIRSILPPFYSFSLIEKICKRKLEKHPNNCDIMWFLGNFYVWHRKYLEAQVQLETLIKIGKDSKGVKLVLSNVYFMLGQYNKVEQILSSPEILSDNDKENYYLGDSLIELRKFDDAIKYLSNYAKYHSKDYVAFVRIGYAYYMKELYEQALQAYRQAERLNPSKKEIKDSINLCLEKLNAGKIGKIGTATIKIIQQGSLLNTMFKKFIFLLILFLCLEGISEARLYPQIFKTYDGSLLKTDTRTGLLNQTISYAYNNDFRLSSMTYAGASQNFIYDNDGLLTKVGSYTITRNTQNGLPKTINDTKLIVNRTFNGYGEIDQETSAIAGNTVYSYQVTNRDNAGRITGKTEIVNNTTINWEYTYDQLGRLIQVKKDNQITEAYTYDANGNRTSTTSILRGINNQTATYSAEDYTMTAGNNTYTFNVDGYLQSKATSTGTNTYNYSSTGQLLSATLENGKTIEYSHDSLGRRIAKKIDGQIIEKYLWLDLTTLLAVYDSNNNLIYRFNYASGRMPNSMEYGGQTLYLSYDQVDSLRAVTDSAGNIIKRIDYDSFGNVISDSNPSFAVPFGFAGGLYDRDTGLVRFGLRDYDPAIGKWTAKDPIDFEGGDTNLFNYVSSDPVNWIDPDGKIAIADDAAIIGLLTLTTMTVAYLESPAGQQMLRDAYKSIEDILKEIDEWKRQKDEELKQCKTNTGPPPKFPGPDPNKPPEDPKLKWKLILVQLLKLISKYIHP